MDVPAWRSCPCWPPQTGWRLPHLHFWAVRSLLCPVCHYCSLNAFAWHFQSIPGLSSFLSAHNKKYYQVSTDLTVYLKGNCLCYNKSLWDVTCCNVVVFLCFSFWEKGVVTLTTVFCLFSFLSLETWCTDAQEETSTTEFSLKTGCTGSCFYVHITHPKYIMSFWK